jgi:hypothetical protein
MNPIEVVILPSQSGSPPFVGLNLIGAIFWGVVTFLVWSSHGWFDHTVGKLIFVPAIILMTAVGYMTSVFIFFMLSLIIVVGCICGWIFDFSFLPYVSEAFLWFSNLILA